MNAARLACSSLIGCALLLAGCAHYPRNTKLAHYDPDAGYRYKSIPAEDNSDSLLVVLAFSGGGHRAAALSYGVLKELARTEIVWEGRPKRLLDEVDIISAVSGGSFTAAYYGLFGEDAFRDFEPNFLNQNIQRRLLWRLASPVNWIRCASPHFGRSDVVAEFYDRHLFAGKTFADLAATGRRPFIIVNATHMSSAARFEFTQDLFDLLCSDLYSVPVARAVAASSAYPILLSPITINSYAGDCGYVEPPEVEAALSSQEAFSRGRLKAREMRAYQDRANHPHVHLLDGGLSDNLGLRSVLEPVLALGGARTALHYFGLNRPRKIVLIAVNADVHHEPGWDQRSRAPGVVQVALSFGDVISRYSFETKQLFRDTVQQWENELNQGGDAADPVRIYGIEVALDQVADPKERQYFDRLPTSFNLPAGAVDRLEDIAGRLLRESEMFQKLLRDLSGGP